jgi:hypothetical protein
MLKDFIQIIDEYKNKKININNFSVEYVNNIILNNIKNNNLNIHIYNNNDFLNYFVNKTNKLEQNSIYTFIYYIIYVYIYIYIIEKVYKGSNIEYLVSCILFSYLTYIVF